MTVLSQPSPAVAVSIAGGFGDAADAPIPRQRPDLLPLLLLPGILLVGFGLAKDLSIWATLTISGLGMGFMLFMAASGLSLVYGLMGVLNFAHGMLLTLGAVTGALLLSSGLIPGLRAWYLLDHPAYNLLAVVVLVLASVLVCVAAGLVVERLFIRPVRHDLLNQVMLSAVGAMIVGELLAMRVGRGVGFALPPNLSGSFMVGDVVVVKMPLLMIGVGLLVLGALKWLLARTRFGILVRAAVNNRDMVEAMGYRTERLFIAAFSLGVALAALAGLFWGMQQASASVSLGSRLLPMMFLVLMIGGTGSIGGSLLGAILLCLLTNYVAYVYPAVTAFAGVLLTIAIVMWRPEGLYPMNKD